MEWEHQNRTPPQPQQPSRGKLLWLSAYPPLLHFGLQIFVMAAVMIAAVLPPIMREALEGANAGHFTPDTAFMDSILPQVTMYSLLISGILSTILFYFLYKHYQRHFSHRMFYTPAIIPLIIVIALAGNFAVSTFVTAIQDFLGTDLPTSTLDDIVGSVPFPLLLLTVCIIVPVAEELCFRGLMFNQLSRAFSFWTANIIQAAVFGLIHGTPVQIGYAFLFGLLLGWIYHRTGRLSSVIVAHIVFNSAFIPFGLIPGIEPLMEDPGGLLLFIFLPAIIITLIAVRFFDSVTSKKYGQTQ
jgi:hypothetical protein